MKETWFKDDEIIVMTQHPKIFSHLDVACYDRETRFNAPMATKSTHPKGDDPYMQIMTYNRIHPIDYISIRMLKRMLPLASRRIKLKTGGRDRVKELIGPTEKAILVHPGISWQSKTIPPNIWNTYIEALQDIGCKVIIIGKNFIANDRGEFRGVHDIDGSINLIDKLDLEEFFAIIELCPALITNDSVPVHVAGAFDNWVGLIPTIKHPDFILPYREVDRSRALFNKPLFDSFDFDPSKFVEIPLSEVDEKDLIETAPSVEQVINFAAEALSL
jgi:hypothetical protein